MVKKSSYLIDIIVNGDIVEVKNAIKNGVDVNLRYLDNLTLLFWAIISEQIEITRILIDSGADINVKAEDIEEFTPLHLAAYKNQKEIMKILIDSGADINAKDKGGETLLHRAAYDNQKEIMKILIDRGADINAMGRDSLIPIHMAIINNQWEAVNLLIRSGATKLKFYCDYCKDVRAGKDFQYASNPIGELTIKAICEVCGSVMLFNRASDYNKNSKKLDRMVFNINKTLEIVEKDSCINISKGRITLKRQGKPINLRLNHV